MAISELAIQRAWLDLNFAALRFRSVGDRSVRVFDPGRWNRDSIGGPDFLDAETWIEGVARHGHVELHLYEDDWYKHGHDQDPAYDDVLLHAVVFAPDPLARRARTASGREVETIVLGPWMPCDLESFAEEYEREGEWEPVLQRLAGPRVERAVLLGRARERWKRRRHFAEYRLSCCGGDLATALHDMTLEILGYRRNANTMLLLARRFPVAHMREEGWTEADYLKALQGWRRSGIRPANQPRARIAQYLRLVRANRGWPDRAAEWVKELARMGAELEGDASGSASRRPAPLLQLHRRVHRELYADTWSGTRAELLITDGLLPLLAAHSGEDLFALWNAWWPGDAPELVNRLAALQWQEADPSLRTPRSHGQIQAALQTLIEDRLRGQA